MKIQTGIWLDTKNAHLVRLQNGSTTSQSIESEVENYNPHGGFGGANKQLPQDAVSERKLLERKKQQLTKYFQAIIQQVNDCDEILIMGPAEAKIGLQKEIEKQKHAGGKILAVQAADVMSPNQLVAKVKAFFE